MSGLLSRNVVSLRMPALGAVLVALLLAALPSHASATQIEDTVCVTANNCIAVGVNDSSAYGYQPRSAIRHWNGAEWTTQSVPWPSGSIGSELSGIACLSASSCKAVGSYKEATGVTRSLAVHWNGTSWSLVTTPGNPTGATASELEGISCASGSSCMAVGSKLTTSSGRRPFALTWNGTAWSYGSAPTEPSGSTASSLSDVACAASLECRAVGEYTVSGVDKPRILLHQSNAWTEESAPLPSGATAGELHDIVCPVAGSCWTVGSWVNSSSVRQPLVLSRSSSWTVAGAPGMSFSQKAELFGISCTSTTSCAAVGQAENENGTPEPVTLSWNGSAWPSARLSLPDPAKRGGLKAVSCVAGAACVATGWVSYSSLDIEKNLAYGGSDEEWSITDDGGRPAAAWSPIGASPAGSELSDAWCPNQETEVRCIEVGSTVDAGGRRSSLIRTAKTNGSTVLAEAPEPPHSKQSELHGVMCVSNAWCMAVGSYFTDEAENTMALRWDGTQWTHLPSPNPSEALGASLEEVFCVSSSGCMAVGSFTTAGGVEKAFALRWDGSSWAVESTYGQAGALGTGYRGVWCSTSTSCSAIGSFTDSGGSTRPLATKLSSGTVTTQVVEQPKGSNSTELLGLSCTSSSHCVAVGRYVAEDGVRKTLAVNYATVEGTPKWLIQTTPNPTGEGQNELAGISCVSTSNCLAVGSGLRNGSVEPLAASWNGTAWTEVPQQSGKNPQFGGPAGIVTTKFHDVSCSSTKAQECHVVGTIQAVDYPARPVSADWLYGGTEKKWSKAPEIGSLESQLHDVSCPELGECVAIGSAWPDSTGMGSTSPPGGAWALDEDQWVPLPSVGSMQVHSGGIDCLATDECMVVGAEPSGGKSLPAAAWWDGEEWTTLEISNFGLEPSKLIFATLDEVSCSAPEHCVAVGFALDVENKTHAVSLAWDGASWAKAGIPSESLSARLTGVSCVEYSDCTAVGTYHEGTVFKAKIFRWNGTAWSAASLPTIPGTDQELQGVTCESESFCMAVGRHVGSEGKRRILGLAWNGTKWTLTSERVLKSGSDFSLEGVACVSSTECVATGSTSPQYEPLALLWNGSTWSVEDASVPRGGQSGRLYETDCASDPELGSACVSVGSFIFRGTVTESKQLREPLTFVREVSEEEEEAESLRTWKPKEVWTPLSSLWDTWCISTSNCIAVGSYNNVFGRQEAQIKSGDGLSWSEVAAPAPAGATASTLGGVTCTSSSFCMAVGSYEDEKDEWKTFAMRWNGSAWTVSTTPNPSGAPYSWLSGVSCSSATSCRAVGSYLNEGDEERAQSLTWNGSSWSIATVPVPSDAIGTQLGAVACTSASHCAAVGSYQRGEGGSKTLIVTWNGSAWSLAASPSVPEASGNDLGDVACASASNCMAVGAYETTTEAVRPIAMRWDGTAWSIIAVPAAGGFRDSLKAVSCPSASSCLAVGTTEEGSETLPMAVAWNGSTWTQSAVESLAIDSQADVFASDLAGVSCASTSSCVAVGAYATQNSIIGDPESEEHDARELSFVFGGSSWTRSGATPATGTIRGISCPDDETCIGVGAGNEPDNGVGTVNQAWRQQNGEWSPLAMPSPSANKVLHDVSCSGASACTAVGTDSSSGKFLAERWNGSSWSAQSLPTPSTGGAHVLLGASCPTSSACAAVGSSQVEGASVLRAVHWNGSTWSESSPAVPGGAASSTLEDVDCTASSNCAAVGSYMDAEGIERPLARHWNGSAWSSATVSAPSEAVATMLEAVSCSSASACTAVGSYQTTEDTSSRRSFVVRWNGIAWSTQTVPQFEEVTRTELKDVSCNTDTECVALGEMVVLEGESLPTTAEYTMTMGWDGTDWTVESASVPNGSPDPSIGALSCSSSQSCVAVGDTHEDNQPISFTTKTDDAGGSLLGASLYAASGVEAAANVPGKPCKENIRNTYKAKRPLTLHTALGHSPLSDRPFVVKGETSVDYCWKRKKVVPGKFRASLNYAEPMGNKDSRWWWTEERDWVQRDCLYNRRKCIAKHYGHFRCCEVVIKNFQAGFWHIRRCAETEVFSPKLDRRAHERNIKDGTCSRSNAIAREAALPADGAPDGDRFGLFWPAYARFFLTNQYGPAAPVTSKVSHYGWSSDVPLVGDWNDDARDSLAVYRPSEARFWMTNSTGASPSSDTSVVYGNPGDVPVVGDWNCDGVDTPGVFRNGSWYMSDSLTSGVTHHSVAYGTSGDIPVVGDWDGDGCDTIGVVRKAGFAANWYLTNTMTGSAPTHYAVSFGLWGDKPVTGDWDDDGDDTFGIYRPTTSMWDLRNILSPGNPDHSFRYGGLEYKPLVGDWDG